MIRAFLLLVAGLAVVALCGCGESKPPSPYHWQDFATAFEMARDHERRIEAIERRLCGGPCP